ncbi:histidine phosphatase family protein [Natranaerobius trueperi]|uniref:phosphoglycerate mutase (2,3-diphosphoglycerate-dependent) n=1 Tax=Natranaerobius trueperi TaxID=759412 RepID=A0A226BYV1_9FIRM|nr:histidine phosphatase family protein [Natranaerobius trueperi]OWZ83504.1 hypothetical protein CDO51_08400 [Natranaerobius trueperi]
MRLLLIRHGETSGNTEKRFQGTKDYPLTDRGEHQIKQLANRLKDESMTAVYTSSLDRARATADEMSKLHNQEPIEEKLLNEYSWGVIEGHTREEIKDKYPSLGMKLEENFFETPIPEEEGLMNLKKRISIVMNNLMKNYNKDDTIAIISHGRVLGGFLVYLTGYSFFNTPWPFTFSNASITKVEYWYDYNKGKIITLNDTCHLKNLTMEG